MGRRTVGLLLVTGFVASGFAYSSSYAQDQTRISDDIGGGLQETSFRTFASRGTSDALAPALRPSLDGNGPHMASQTTEPVRSDAVKAPVVWQPAEATAAAEIQISQAQTKSADNSASKGAPAQNSKQVTAPSVSSPPKPAITVTPPLPAAGPTPAATVAPTGSWPKTLPEAKAEAEALANPQSVQQSWSQPEIEIAKARCTAILKGIDAVTIPEPAMRHGDCGAPAPVRLVSIGRNPEVALSPPPVLTCDMVVALHTWVKTDLQPLAKTHLGAQIIKIETMSDYSCRNAYGRTKSRLSEHGKANALDIRGFVTAKGDPAMLLADWGLTARDVAAQVAVAKAEADKKAREKAATEAAALAARSKEKGQPRAPGTSIGKAPSELASQPGAAGPALGFRDGGATLSEGLPKVKLTIPGVAPDDDDDKPRGGSAFGVEPSRLGGPVPARTTMSGFQNAISVRAEKDAGKSGKPAAPTAAPTAAPATVTQPPTPKGRTPITHEPASSRDQTSAKAKFLREAHASGCRIFGTILGPEANNAHRNHFHVDMAERKTRNYCE